MERRKTLCFIYFNFVTLFSQSCAFAKRRRKKTQENIYFLIIICLFVSHKCTKKKQEKLNFNFVF